MRNRAQLLIGKVSPEIAQASIDIESWQFSVLQEYSVPPEVESKYRHGISFIRHCEKLRASRVSGENRSKG
jgi:hypothetical protein